MRRAHVYLFLLPFLITRVYGSSSVASLPACGLQCVLHTLPASGCAFNDNACICSNRDLVRESAKCLVQNCTMSEYMTMARLTAETCDLPFEHIGYRYSTVVYVLVALSTVCVLLRYVTKVYFVRSPLHLDDYLIGFCMATGGLAIWISHGLVRSGLGQHLYQLTSDELSDTLRFFWLGSILYITNLGIVKLAVLVFYLRIFPYERFRFFTRALIIFTILSTILSLGLSIFQCTPIAKFWDQDLKGKCMDVEAAAYSAAGMVIASDIMTVVLPLPVVRRLNMGVKRKIGVMAMFTLGSAGCVFSIVRLHSLIYYGKSLDPTIDLLPATIFSTLECGIPLITICFPQLRRLYSHFFPTTPKTTFANKETFDTSKSGTAPKYWFGTAFSDPALTGAGTFAAHDVEDGMGMEELVLNDVGGILGGDEKSARDDNVVEKEGEESPVNGDMNALNVGKTGCVDSRCPV